MSGAHNTLIPAVLEALRARGGDDIVVFGGGIIPDEDAERLRGAGVKGIFTPGTTLKAIVEWVHANVIPHG
jgi:methylmalonyl-CoA mutase C-terminal domain/subunit